MVRSIIVVCLILTVIFISIRLLLGEVPSVVHVRIVVDGRRGASIALIGGRAGVLVAASSGILRLPVMTVAVLLMVLNR